MSRLTAISASVTYGVIRVGLASRSGSIPTGCYACCNDERLDDREGDGNYGPGMAKAVGAFIAANGGPDTFPGEGRDTIGPIMEPP